MEPIKVKHIGGRPNLRTIHGGDGYRVIQCDWKTFCKIDGPIGNKIEAVKKWNKLALAMNGDE